MNVNKFYENERSEQENRSWNAKYGHVKRRILADEPLKGKTLKFALKLLKSEKLSEDNISRNISEKIKKGEIISNYEKYIGRCNADIFKTIR